MARAVWSRSPFLATAIYGYVNSDLHHYAFQAALVTGESAEEIRDAHARLQEAFPVGGDLGWRGQQNG